MRACRFLIVLLAMVLCFVQIVPVYAGPQMDSVDVGSADGVLLPTRHSPSLAHRAEAGSDMALASSLSSTQAVAGWYGNGRSYRVTVVVDAAGTARLSGRPVEVDLNFTALLAQVGQTQPFDEDSLLVLEVNASGSSLGSPIGHQFNPADGFDALVNAQGAVIFLLDGATAANETRFFHLYFDVSGKGFSPPAVSPLISFTPFVYDEGLTTYQIGTPTGVYFYDVIGGGFSSLNDTDGQDWISWNLQGESVYRGVPNMVYYPPSTGSFHPGKSGVTTTKLHSGPYNVSFLSTFDQGAEHWEVVWDIFPNFARMTVLQASDDYWFLYEGTPGGDFDSADYLVRSDGSTVAWDQTWCRDTDNYVNASTFCTESTGPWDEEWVYFVDPNAGSNGRSLFVAHHENDDVVDYYAKHYHDVYRMTVFGFGRLGAEDYQPGEELPRHFTIGLMDAVSYADGAQVVRSAYQSLDVSVSATETPLAVNAEIATDSFNACSLDETIWTYTDPLAGTAGEATLHMTGAKAQIAVPGGVAHDVWSNINNAPRLLQSVENGNFDMMVRYASPVEESIQMQGILVVGDAENFLRFNVQYDGGDARILGIRFVDGVPSVDFNQLIESGGAPLYLRLTRNGVEWRLMYSYDPDDPDTPWLDAGGTTVLYHGLTMTQIGLFAGNAGATPPAFTTLVDYVYRVGDSVNPNDVKALTLEDILAASPIDPTNVGQIVGEPVNGTAGNPACGDPFRLTAVATKPGWAFTQWRTTNFTDEANPLVRSFAYGEQVVAEFDQFGIELLTPIVSEGAGVGGRVTRTPDKEIYVYGERVTLRALPSPGWDFGGWSGDLVDSNAQTEIVLTDSANITATFVQQRYAVEVAVESTDGGSPGSSTASASPPSDPAGYVYGETVRLTAVPAPGWRFDGWHGDAAGAELQTTVTLTGPANVTARFAQEHYAIQVSSQDEDGTAANESTVTLSPPSHPAGYVYGESVVMTAKPAPGWAFLGWAGDVSGDVSPRTITVQGDLAVIARFAQVQYAVTVDILPDESGQSGSVTVTPAGPFLYGQRVTLQAKSADGWYFQRWMGDLSGSSSTKTLFIDGDKHVTAVFAEGMPPAPTIFLPLLVGP